MYNKQCLFVIFLWFVFVPSVLAIVLLAGIVVRCNIDPSSFPSPPNLKNHELSDAKINEYELATLSYEELPYTIWRLSDPENNPNPVDENGIEIFEINGDTCYHALHLCQRMQWYLDSYYQTRDSLYLEWTRKYYDKLIELSVEEEDIIYFPYYFDWPMHGNQDELMIAPWLSALTQGIALMVFTRLYIFTGDREYHEIARKTFNSFKMVVGKHEPWITMVDENKYLWFEEYPNALEQNMTLNGFIFCIYGLFEYWSLTKSSEVERFLKAAITTVENYINEFRVPGGISYYCLKHKAQYPKYHKIHIDQLRTLYVFTGYKYFEAMAELFYNDYH